MINEVDIAKYLLFKYEDPLLSFNGSTQLGRDLNIEWNKIYDARQKIKECNSIDEIKIQNTEIAKLCDTFRKKYETIEDQNVIRFINCINSNAVYSENANIWIDEALNEVKNDSKDSRLKEVEEYVSKGHTLPQKLDLRIYNEIREKSFEILNKYNLGTIIVRADDDLGSLHFLNKIEANLQTICNKTGISPEEIGHSGNLAFALPNTNLVGQVLACYVPSVDTITLTNPRVNESSTILHEWIHSLDFKIGNQIRPGHYATNIEESVVDNDSSEYKAFRAIKDLVQKFINSGSSKVEKKKENLLNEGASKFLTTLLGKDYYGLPSDKKDMLNSKEMIKNINNYLTSPEDTNFIKNIENTLELTGLLTEEVKLTLKTQPDNIKEIKSYFDAVNKNLLGSESLYLMGSNFSNFVRNLETKDTPIAQGNGADKDYYSQPTEMLARYFESQFFTEEVVPSLSEVLTNGRMIYKKKDKSFLENKTSFFDNALSRVGSFVKPLYSSENVLNRVGEIRAKALDKENTEAIAPKKQ